MQVLSVSQVSEYLVEVVSQERGLQDLWVEGEVSEVTVSVRGHCYFTLKDDRTSLPCVLFRTDYLRVGFAIEPGMTLVAHGKASVYGGPRTQVQLVLDQAQPSGTGGLYLAFEQLRRRLEREGLFDAALKRRPPFLPRRVAVVTSEGGAALRDVLRVLRRRCAIVPVLLVHTAVQGETAPVSIARALRQAGTREGVDVVLLVRGGGSIEDLAAFNAEEVARAIRASGVPVIVGVGHDTDYTIADFAADVRAPTPSAAAEMAVPNLADLRRDLVARRQALDGAVGRALSQRAERLETLGARLERQSPARRLPELQQRLDERTQRLARALTTSLERARQKLAGDRARLEALSPLAVLARGYSLARDGEGHVLTSVAGLHAGQRLVTVFADGQAMSTVDQVEVASRDA